MSCITKGNVRCTKCCQAIHMMAGAWRKMKLKKASYVDGDIVMSKWVRISRRRAKKINPFIMANGHENGKMDYFKCKSLTEHGCGDYEGRPDICRSFNPQKGDQHTTYSPTCKFDNNIIARG